MLIVSQNKEKVLWFGRAFNALEYAESVDHKGKKETIRHTICISDGCLEEVAEYPTKERCLAVLKDFCEAYKDECYTVDFSILQHKPPDRERISGTQFMSFR